MKIFSSELQNPANFFLAFFLFISGHTFWVISRKGLLFFCKKSPIISELELAFISGEGFLYYIL